MTKMLNCLVKYYMDIKMKYTIKRKFLNTKQTKYIIDEISELKFFPTPFMGNYEEVIFNQNNSHIGSSLLKAISAIIKMTDVKQDFNTIIVKKFEVGNYVIPHRDSRNTVGRSVTIFVGDTDVQSQCRFDGNLEDISSGDIIIQECTNGYSMGPQYSMNPLQSGTLYAVTICTILKENQV